MRVVQIEQPGPADLMTVVEVPTPTPGTGQVLVEVEAAGINFIDTYQRSGAYKVPFPFRLGLEGAGIVRQLGEGVAGVSVGQRVAWASVSGSYSSHVVAAAEKLVVVPNDISGEIAAALMLQGMTAHYLVNDTFALKNDQWCVVHAAAGGVGLILCQLAKAKGANVIAIVSTKEKANLVEELGATPLLASSDWVAETRKLTGEQGVHVVYDSVGKDTFDRSINCLRPRGMMVLYGQASGAVAPFDPQILAAKGSLFFTRPTLGHYTASRDELQSRASALFELVASKQLSVRIGNVFTLDQAADAHRAIESRGTTGKILLRLRNF